MSDRIAELIQLEVDGVISATELAELDEAASADPVTRDERERMRDLARDLDQLAWREPASALPENVLRAINEIGPHRKRRAWPRWRIERRQAFAFAAGIVVTKMGTATVGPDELADALTRGG